MPFGTAGVVTCLGWAFIFGLGVAGQPHLVTKMMMSRNIADNRIVLPVSLLGYAFAALLWISIGTVMRALVIDGQAEPLTAPDQAAAFFLSVFASPMLAGIVFAGLFAAIMSTADAFLNVGAAAIVHDIPKAFGVKQITNELLKARIVTVILAVAAALIALASDTLVAFARHHRLGHLCRRHISRAGHWPELERRYQPGGDCRHCLEPVAECCD